MLMQQKLGMISHKKWPITIFKSKNLIFYLYSRKKQRQQDEDFNEELSDEEVDLGVFSHKIW